MFNFQTIQSNNNEIVLQNNTNDLKKLNDYFYNKFFINSST